MLPLPPPTAPTKKKQVEEILCSGESVFLADVKRQTKFRKRHLTADLTQTFVLIFYTDYFVKNLSEKISIGCKM